MPLSLGTGHLAFLMESCFFQMASYCDAAGRHSTSKHGIVISQYQNALVRVNPKIPTNLLKVYLIAIIESVINVKIVWKTYEA